MPTFTVIESPFAGKTPVQRRRHIQYLHAAIQDCLKRGEVPYASHGFFPGALDDNIPAQRQAGIEAGFAIASRLTGDGLSLGATRAFYIDRGMSQGMTEGLADARKDEDRWFVDIRTLGTEWAIENDPVCLSDLHSDVTMHGDRYSGFEFTCVSCGAKVIPTSYKTV